MRESRPGAAERWGRVLRWGFAAAGLWAAGSCGTGTEPDRPPVDAVIVTAGASQLIVGQTMVMAVRLEDVEGTALTDRLVSWSSTNETVATISNSGLVRALDAGSTEIVASSEGRSGSVMLTVLPAVASIVVEPEADTLLPGSTLQLTVIVRDAAGNSLAGRTVEWQSRDTEAASVSATGLVSAEQPGGPLAIVATSEGKSDSALIWISPSACESSEPVTVGETKSGSLQSGDCEVGDESYADFWRFTTDTAVSIAIEMLSTAFEPWVWIRRDTQTIAFGDSVLRLQLEPGPYLVGASSVTAGASGAYSLAIRHDPNAAGCAIPTPIDTGLTVTGSLTSLDCLIFDEHYADRWRLTLTSGESLEFRVHSADFVPWVVVMDTSGVVQVQGAYGGTGTHSVRATLPAGVYDVRPSTALPLETGDYELFVRRDPCAAVAFELGDTASGIISASDCLLPDSSFSDPYRLVVDSTDLIRIELKSAEFDAYLMLTKPDATSPIVATDDDGGGGSDGRIETTLDAGTYLIWAGGDTPRDTGEYRLSATAVPDGATNLVIDGAYIVQSTQRYDGTVPIVRDQPAHVRVFGRANVSGTAGTTVRVYFHRDGSLVDSLTIAGPTTIPTMIDEGDAALSWNAEVPADLLRLGTSYSVRIDPDNLIAEGDEADNEWPADGPRSVDVRSVPSLGLTVVPVLQGNGLLAAFTTAEIPAFIDVTRRLYPLDTISVDIRSTYTTGLVFDGSPEPWYNLLGELELIRVVEKPDHHYYGLVRVSWASGTGLTRGMAAVSGRVAASVEGTAGRSAVVAHELGHNFGRGHSPCGVGSGDAAYPYPDGRIGVHGWDRATQTVIDPLTADIMSYCTPRWIGDYTFRKVLEYRDTSPAVQAAPGPVIVVWGAIIDGQPRLEPVFQLTASPTPVHAGAWEAVVSDTGGVVITRQSFRPLDIGHEGSSRQTFALALPVAEKDAARIGSVLVRGPAAATERQYPVEPLDRRDSTTDMTLARGSRETLVRWVSGRYPAALVRDARTGRVLSIVRNGLFVAPRGSPRLELFLSDGIRTHRRVIEP